MKKPILALAAAGLLLAATGTGAAAAAAWKEPAKSYGGCVSKSSGYVRVLERNNLAKSVNGTCKSTERKITFPSRTGVVLPSKLVFKRATGTDTCTKAASTSSTWTFTCVATPVPSPSPSPTVSPSPTAAAS